jgi:adenosylcobinamide-GDP ribazoletransferase
MNDLRTAFGLLTIFPVRYDASRISARAFAYYPFVGLVIGAILTAVQFLLQLTLPHLVAAVLVVTGWAIITGGLHLDGFADACDALFAATTRERRLEILRDVHLGSFGVAGLILLLMLKAATVTNATTLAPIFLAPILGRWAMTYAVTFPPARKEGMAVLFRAGLTRRITLTATVFAGMACAILGWLGIAAFTIAFAIAALVARVAMNRLGGLTGDIYGMICESVEVGVLLVGAAGILK